MKLLQNSTLCMQEESLSKSCSLCMPLELLLVAYNSYLIYIHWSRHFLPIEKTLPQSNQDKRKEKKIIYEDVFSKYESQIHWTLNKQNEEE